MSYLQVVSQVRDLAGVLPSEGFSRLARAPKQETTSPRDKVVFVFSFFEELRRRVPEAGGSRN